MAYDFSKFKNGLKEVENWLAQELTQIRTGRAALSFLDSVRVESYGSLMPLNQVGNLSIEDPKTIRITPWDQSQIKPIEKAISISNLGVSAVVDDKGVRVVFPELTGERRTLLAKNAKQKVEEAKITLRQEREKVLADVEAKFKQGGMGEDEKFKLKADVQKFVDETQKKLIELGDKKEKEIVG